MGEGDFFQGHRFGNQGSQPPLNQPEEVPPLELDCVDLSSVPGAQTVLYLLFICHLMEKLSVYWFHVCIGFGVASKRTLPKIR